MLGAEAFCLSIRHWVTPSHDASIDGRVKTPAAPHSGLGIRGSGLGKEDSESRAPYPLSRTPYPVSRSSGLFRYSSTQV